MSTNEFDKLVAAKLKEATYAYEPADWGRLTVQLDAERRKKRAVLFFYALPGMAAALLVVLLGAYLYRSNKTPAIVSTRSHVQTPVSRPGGKSIVGAPADAAHQSSVSRSVLAVSKTHKQVAVNKTTKHAPPAVDAAPGSSATPTDTATITLTANKPTIYSDGLPPPNAITHERVKRQTSLSLAGGANYGTLNGGYSVNAVATRALSGKFDIELAIGYVSGSGSVASGTAAPPVNGLQPNKPVAPKASPLNYLQFAPVADYRLTQKITLGAGADLQRLLQADKPTVVYNDKEKVAPLLDAGILLKTDYAFAKRLKAGIAYRVGINNVVVPGNNYIDRSYLQVQVRYRLR